MTFLEARAKATTRSLRSLKPYTTAPAALPQSRRPVRIANDLARRSSGANSAATEAAPSAV